PAGGSERTAGGSERTRPTNTSWSASNDEALGLRGTAPDPESRIPDPGLDPDLDPSPLREPWRWERVLMDAVVIGQDAARWKRRLEGWRRELQLQIREIERQEGKGAA